MGEKTLRHMLLGKLHRAVVTRADLDGPDAVRIDRALMDAAGFLEHEKAELYDVTTGSRFSAAIVAADRDSGEFSINGAAAHLVRPGNLVVVAVYGWVKAKKAAKHVPLEVKVDDQNRSLSPPREDIKNPMPSVPDPFATAQVKAQQRAKKIRARAKPAMRE